VLGTKFAPNHYVHKFLFITAMLTVGFARLASAAGLSDPLIEGAKQCTRYFPTEEQNQAIPVHLLAAISTTETGRWHPGLGMALPWPWTINVEGKGYYYGSKAEALAATQKFLRAGKRSIDVGCMQVNLKHHPRAFSDLNAAFDPATNVAYAASFLKKNYNEMGNWIQAAAAYHSRTSHLGRSYLARVEKNWTNIVNKVRAARGEGQLVSAAPAMRNAAAESAPAAATRVARSARSMRDIQVVSVAEPLTARRNDVLVIRAQTTAAASSAPAVATASLNSSLSDTAQGNGIDNGATASHSSANATTFVFAN
jgi:hypothetical protein